MGKTSDQLICYPCMSQTVIGVHHTIDTMLASLILYILAEMGVGYRYCQMIIDLGLSGYMSSLAMPKINVMAKPLTTCMELFFPPGQIDTSLSGPGHHNRDLGAHMTIHPRPLHSDTLSQIITWPLGHCVINTQSMLLGQAWVDPLEQTNVQPFSYVIIICVWLNHVVKSLAMQTALSSLPKRLGWALVLPLSSSDHWFKPELLWTWQKFSSKFGLQQEVNLTFGSRFRLICTCRNHVKQSWHSSMIPVGVCGKMEDAGNIKSE